jgi:hypothetical protein
VKNPFEIHQMEHLSPSTINTFTAAPALFVLEKLLKRRQPVGCAAYRGNAVEAGIAHGLLNPTATLQDCIAEATRTFDKLACLSGDPRKDKERAGLAGMVEQGLAELLPYGVPSAVQGKVSLDVEGLAVPIIGFFDFEWEQHGVLLDLKTTHALPSEIKRTHAKQVSLYTACRGNHEGRICYSTAKKVATYRLENPREHLNALTRGALALQRFLSLSDDPKELSQIVMPDLDSFYWTDPGARQAAFEVWGV